MNNNQNININMNSLLSSLTSGRIILNFGDTQVDIDITVNKKVSIVEEVANKIVEEVDKELGETKKTESNVSKDYVCGNEPYPVIPDEDDEPVVDKLMAEELDKDECCCHEEKHNENETGWFKGEFRYGGKTRSSLHYYEDGIAICDTGVVSRNHILSENHVKVDNPVTVDCCRKCQLVLVKRKTATYREIQKSNNVNATGWYLRMTDSRKGVYKHFYKDGHTICRNQWQLTSIDKVTSLDTDNEYKICKVCLERAKANSKSDVSNKTVIKTLSSKDVIRPHEMMARWEANLVNLKNPVPLNDTEGDDIYIEAAKRLLVVFRKSINNTMRKLSSDNRMTVDNTNIKFYCKNKIVEFNVTRNPNQKNSELNIRKINVVNRTSPNQKITGNAYDMTSMVTKVILERSRMLNEKED